MHFKNIKDLRVLIEELYSHIRLLKKTKPTLSQKDAERCDKTILNLQSRIVELEKLP